MRQERISILLIFSETLLDYNDQGLVERMFYVNDSMNISSLVFNHTDLSAGITLA